MKLAWLGALALATAKDAKIDTVVVLMLENRAFDHMCGFLKRINPDINGLNGNEINRVNSSDPNSKACQANDRADYKTYPDPNHSVPAVTTQIFGYGPQTADPAPMSGFVEAYAQNCDIMNSFNATRVPTISQLAQNFALFDAWYSSVPGPTFPNRLYWHSATSYGTSKNDGPKEIGILVEGYPQKTVYQAMNESGYSWKGYFDEVPDMLLFKWHRHASNVKNLKPAGDFFTDAKEGKLPNLAFFSPRYYSAPGMPANDQHPDHDVQEAEQLMAKVYEAVRKSPQWNSSLLIITYDEHGGLYDHVSPPMKGIPNPDGQEAEDPPFKFDRLGVRVPTILVSPWVPKGAVIHEPAASPASHYDHTSFSATLKKMFDLPNFLTKRDAWASTFDHVWNSVESLRTDCPLELERAEQPPLETTGRAVGDAPIMDLQKDFINLAIALHNGNNKLAASALQTEAEAGAFVRNAIESFIEQAQHAKEEAA